MTDIRLNSGDLAGAASDTRGAAASVGDGGAAHIAAAADGMPGSTSAQQLEDWGPDWASDLEDWRDAVDDFASSLDDHGSDMTGTDSSSGGLLGGITGLFGGGG